MHEMQELQVQSLGCEDPLEKEMATHSSILAFNFYGQRTLAGYSQWGCKRVRCDWAQEQTEFQEAVVSPVMVVCWVQSKVQFSCSVVSNSATPWTAAHQASLSITDSQSLLKFMSIQSVMPSNNLILSSSSPPTFNLCQHQGLFQWVSSSHQVAKVLAFQLQHQSFQWIFRNDFL